jgi:ribulose-phosphate 3-epimerase
MITEPLEYAKAFVDAGSDFITFHVETVSDPVFVINEIKKLGVKVGLSIKPNTGIDSIMDYLPMIDQVLVMSVEPGFGGQKFKESALPKIKELSVLKKALDIDFVISVDGGINADTGKLCKDAGADVLVAGSYIFNSDDPEARIESLR